MDDKINELKNILKSLRWLLINIDIVENTCWKGVDTNTYRNKLRETGGYIQKEFLNLLNIVNSYLVDFYQQKYNELLKIYDFYLKEYYKLLDGYENIRFEDITFVRIFRSKSVAREICNLLDIIKIYNNRKLYN